MNSKLKPLSLLEGLQGRTRRNTGFILLVLLLVSCIGLLASALKFDDRLVAVRAADSDNQGWLVAQLEVDYQAFIIALGAVTQNADLDSGANLVELHSDAVLRFDIFYSRTSVLTASLADELLPTRLETMLQSLVAVPISIINPSGLLAHIHGARHERSDRRDDLECVLVLAAGIHHLDHLFFLIDGRLVDIAFLIRLRMFGRMDALRVTIKRYDPVDCHRGQSGLRGG